MDKLMGSLASRTVNDSTKKEDQLECEELNIHDSTPPALEPSLWPECSLYRVPRRLGEVKHMPYMTRPSTAANDSSTKEEELECKMLIIDIPLALEPPRWPECCIYRVPRRLRQVKHMAYTPRIVSFGPFHHRMREELKDMEIQKLKYLRDFCYRTGKSIEDLACIIQDKEVKIRRCYSETFLLSSEEFVNMILLDAIFILELLWGASNKSKADKKKDYILSQPSLKQGIKHDLLLLENQLPFFILVELYSCGDQHNQVVQQNGELQEVWLTKKTILLKQSLKFFADFCYEQPEPEIGEVKHFTDLLRSVFRPPSPMRRRNRGIRYTATKLDEVGLKFTRPTTRRSLLEIQMPENCCIEKFPCFNLSWLLACLPCLKSTCLMHMQRFLEIPPFQVDDNTEGLFRNMMAFEQCHYPYETYICDYILLLDDLIITEEDVRFLADKKIIINLLGSNVAVTNLVNNLGLEIQVSRKSIYGKLSEDLLKYCESNCNRLVGVLTRVYFTNFFKGTATIVGIIILGFTLWNFSRLFSK